ncbi:MAG: tetratricopeptide repeat protein [Verrucomicrobiota bacterium]|nr:tetratricopeptide repeat protein [Verrucomicrobiota bacterium]
MSGSVSTKLYIIYGLLGVLVITGGLGVYYYTTTPPDVATEQGSLHETVLPEPSVVDSVHITKRIADKLVLAPLVHEGSIADAVLSDALYVAEHGDAVNDPVALLKAALLLKQSEKLSELSPVLARVRTLFAEEPEQLPADTTQTTSSYPHWLFSYTRYCLQEGEQPPSLRIVLAEWMDSMPDAPSLQNHRDYLALGRQLIAEALPVLPPAETAAALKYAIARERDSLDFAELDRFVSLLSQATTMWQSSRAYPEIASVLAAVDEWVAAVLAAADKPKSQAIQFAAQVAGVQATYFESRRDFTKTADAAAREAALWRELLKGNPNDTRAHHSLRVALVGRAGAALALRQPATTEALCQEALGDNSLDFAVTQPESAARCETLLGRAMIQQGKSAGAIIHLQSARSLYESLLGASGVDDQRAIRNTLADIDLDNGRALLEDGKFQQAIAPLEQGLAVRRSSLDAQPENTRPNLELARHYGRLAEAMEKSGNREGAANALREKLHFEELAAAHSFRAEAIQTEMARTRAWLARLLGSGGKSGAVIEQLAERYRLLGQQVVNHPEDTKAQTVWLEALGELGRTRLATDSAGGLAGDFLFALETLEAIPENAITAGASFPLLKIRLFWLQSTLLIDAGQPEAAAQAITRASALLNSLHGNLALSTAERAIVAEALCERGETLLTARSIREAYQAFTQARTFLEPTGNTATAQAYPELRARILAKLGHIQLLRGHAEPALELLAQAALALDVLGPTPEKAEMELETNALRGEALASSGDVSGALDAYTRALAQAEKLWGEQPEQDERRLRLADIWHGKGSAHAQRAEFPQAVDAYRREQLYLLTIARFEADTGKLALPLIRNYRTLADCQLKLNTLDALADASRLVDSAEALLKRLPESRQQQSDIQEQQVYLHRTLAQVRASEKRFLEADTEIQKAVKLAGNSKLFSATEDERGRQLIGQLWLVTADIREQSGDMPGMVTALQDAFHSLNQTSSRTAPGLSSSASDPRIIAERIASYFERQAQPERAYPWRYEQRNLATALLREYPKHRALVLDCIRLETTLSHLAQLQRQFVEAEAHLNEALALIDRARDHQPASTELVPEELHTLRLLADLHEENGDLAEAINSYEDCWRVYDQKLPSIRQLPAVRIEALEALLGLTRTASKDKNLSGKKTTALAEARKLLDELYNDVTLAPEERSRIDRLQSELERVPQVK